ncbi:hypothetical protein DYI22_12305 [Marinobacter lipolyticus]|nr:hypothetical protein [Marinobacter lipolyticus]
MTPAVFATGASADASDEAVPTCGDASTAASLRTGIPTVVGCGSGTFVTAGFSSGSRSVAGGAASRSGSGSGVTGATATICSGSVAVAGSSAGSGSAARDPVTGVAGFSSSGVCSESNHHPARTAITSAAAISNHRPRWRPARAAMGCPV